MKDITEIVKDLLNSLDFQFNAETVTPVGNDFVLTTCNTYWLRPMKTIVIGGNNYLIKSIVINQSITLTPIGHLIPPTTGLIFSITKPTYRHGTARAINAELVTILQKEKTPFAWLVELIEETRDYDVESVIGLTSQVQLLLFDEANPENMFTENHYSDIIRPLKQLADELVSKINNNTKNFLPVKEVNITGLPDWGALSQSGFEKRIFDEKWSGIQLKFELVVNKEFICCD